MKDKITGTKTAVVANWYLMALVKRESFEYWGGISGGKRDWWSPTRAKGKRVVRSNGYP